MRNIKCLIVDDEPIARDIVRNYCSRFEGVQVIADCGNVFDARKVLQESSIDILFLDINLPVLDGIGFLKTLKALPQVIFTTAYKEYAVTAFDLAACDYLVKPFSLERFMIAVDKAVEKLIVPTQDPDRKERDQFFIKAEGKIHSLRFQEILYAEAKGNYTKIATTKRTIMPALSFTGAGQLLPAELFIRVHRSFIIGKLHIASIEGNVVLINNFEIPIGMKYKDEFLRSLGI